MSWLFAFAHHIAAFALVAALTVEVVLIKGELTMQRARQLQLADLIAAALMILFAALMARGVASFG